jgi:hypothetical protein
MAAVLCGSKKRGSRCWCLVVQWDGAVAGQKKKSKSARDSLILHDVCVRCEMMGKHMAKALVGTKRKKVRGHSPKFRTS